MKYTIYWWWNTVHIIIIFWLKNVWIIPLDANRSRSLNKANVGPKYLRTSSKIVFGWQVLYSRYCTSACGIFRLRTDNMYLRGKRCCFYYYYCLSVILADGQRIVCEGTNRNPSNAGSIAGNFFRGHWGSKVYQKGSYGWLIK